MLSDILYRLGTLTRRWQQAQRHMTSYSDDRETRAELKVKLKVPLRKNRTRVCQRILHVAPSSWKLPRRKGAVLKLEMKDY